MGVLEKQIKEATEKLEEMKHGERFPL